MELYHYTSRFHYDFIKQNGIIKGDVPISPAGGFNSPWLTANKNRKQLWAEGSNVDKTEVRLTVVIPENMLANLWKWDDVCKQYLVESWWKKALNETGGGDDYNWYIYKGKIKTDWIIAHDLFIKK